MKVLKTALQLTTVAAFGMTSYYHGWEAKTTQIGDNYIKLTRAMQKLVRNRRKVMCGLSSAWFVETAVVLLFTVIALYIPWAI